MDKEKLSFYTCLPFGLASALLVFTKLLRPVVAHLRKAGIRLIIYLDDILVMSPSASETITVINSVRSALESLRFIVNELKSIFKPTQSIEFLGIMVNSSKLAFCLPPKKVESILNLCKQSQKCKTISLREIASILGLLNWASMAIPYARSHWRQSQSFYIERSKVKIGN